MKRQTTAQRLPRLGAFGVNRGHQEKSKRRNCALTLRGLRRRAFYRPLALAMSVLLIPSFSWFESVAGIPLGSSAKSFQASAQTTGGTGCQAASATAIIQTNCVNGQLFNLFGDLNQLESDSVNAYLALHALPATDASVIYTYGRQDLRDEIRASMFTQMLAIIKKAASERTQHEQTLFNWLQLLVQQNEIALYTNAITESGRFFADPCTFTLDADIASAYKLSYDGHPFCGGLQSNIFTPPVPAASYFTAYGFKTSYGAPAEQFKEFGSLMADTSLSVGAQAGISLSAGAVAAAITGVALYANLSAALAAWGTALAAGEVTVEGVGALAAGSSFILSGSTVSAIGLGTAVAAPVAIVLIAVAAGVIAALQLATNIERENDIANFSNLLTQAQNNLPDLAAMVADTSGLGNYKIQATMNSQTVPDKPSATVLPVHRPGTDFTFEIAGASGAAPSISSILTYQDWDGNQAKAETWGGWFLETCTTVNAPCLVGEGINADIRYVDAAGVKWTASRMGNNFVHTKAQPASTDLICPADTKTGVTPAGTDLTKCAAYVTDNITLKDVDGNLVTAKLSVLTPPVISGSTLLAFGPGIPSTQSITMIGNPAPTVCLSSGSLPADFSLNGGNCGTGSFRIQFNGNRDAAIHTYALTLSARNSVGNISIPVTVDVSPQLAIISPNVLNVTAGLPVNFTVVATGIPTPKLSASENLLGLSFKDSGDGTATISGVVPYPQSNAVCFAPCNTGISATNSQGTVTQFLAITAGSPPLANLVPPTSTTFSAGVPNQHLLYSNGAITSVSWSLIPDPKASWLKLKDNGDGTALLTGTPPAGTSGTFNPKIGPVAFGTFTVINPFPVTVENIPVYLSPNTATFTVGKESSFAISASEGDITLVGALPEGLTFNTSVNGPVTQGSSAVISGTPAAGTGGQYTLNLVATAPGTAGPGTQALTLNINEAPIFTGPCPSANCTVEVPAGGTFAVTTTGFPFMSSGRLPASSGPLPSFSAAGEKWMSFYLLHLPAGFTASNLNAEGFATGTLTIQAPPSAPLGAQYAVAIFADNGVQPQAEKDIFIKIVKPTEPAAFSGTQ
ncbi:MAG: putative Ig domain-containing protein [Bryobacteraceae bacterium]